MQCFRILNWIALIAMLGCGEPPFLERSSVPFLEFCVLYCISLYCIVSIVFLCIVLYCIVSCVLSSVPFLAFTPNHPVQLHIVALPAIFHLYSEKTNHNPAIFNWNQSAFRKFSTKTFIWVIPTFGVDGKTRTNAVWSSFHAFMSSNVNLAIQSSHSGLFSSTFLSVRFNQNKNSPSKSESQKSIFSHLLVRCLWSSQVAARQIWFQLCRRRSLCDPGSAGNWNSNVQLLRLNEQEERSHFEMSPRNGSCKKPAMMKPGQQSRVRHQNLFTRFCTALDRVHFSKYKYTNTQIHKHSNTEEGPSSESVYTFLRGLGSKNLGSRPFFESKHRALPFLRPWCLNSNSAFKHIAWFFLSSKKI